MVAGGNEEQLAVVGEEEEVHSTLDFCNHRQWGGWKDLTVVAQGFGGVVLGKGLSECISNSHMMQLSVLVVAVLFCC